MHDKVINYSHMQSKELIYKPKKKLLNSLLLVKII